MLKYVHGGIVLLGWVKPTLGERGTDMYLLSLRAMVLVTLGDAEQMYLKNILNTKDTD